MTLKKLSLATVALTAFVAAGPVLADPPHWAPAYASRAQAYDGGGYGRHDRQRDHRPKKVVVNNHYYYPEREVLVYRDSPPVYEPAPAYRPAPVVYAGAGPIGSTVGGAVIGAVIGSRFGGGSGRVASIALGTVIGAHIGERLGRY